MILGIPKEILHDELRVAALPETVAEYRKMGFEVLVQSTAGEGSLRSDEEYKQAGATIIGDAETLFAKSDVILKVKQPWLNERTKKHEVEMMRPGSVLATFLHPAAPPNHDMIRMLASKNITALTMDGIPRTSRAQNMDALTSMSTVTGYRSMLIAANHFPKFIPTMSTTMGTLKPAKVLIVGIGVVGLQAIAAAKRLGASIKAVDIREDACKAADSLGAKIVGFEVPQDIAIGEGGYAKALTAEWLDKERKEIEPYVEEADIIILSALVPCEIAPVLITEEMVQKMKPGSVIIDVSIDQGGNCALAGRMPGHMHVLLAEAEADPDMLFDLAEIDSQFQETDLALIVGACDVVNPAAMNVEGTPISGMPILSAHEAKQILVCNLDDKPGYSGVDNPLYKNPKTILLLGNAKEKLSQLIEAFN